MVFSFLINLIINWDIHQKSFFFYCYLFLEEKKIDWIFFKNHIINLSYFVSISILFIQKNTCRSLYGSGKIYTVWKRKTNIRDTGQLRNRCPSFSHLQKEINPHDQTVLPKFFKEDIIIIFFFFVRIFPTSGLEFLRILFL